MTTPRASKQMRWLAAALVTSLAVNAFLIGATATDLVHIRWPFLDPGPAPPLRFELRWLAGRLPPEGMKRVEDAVMAVQPDALAHMDRLRTLRSELGVLAAVPAPDRAAIDAKLVEIRAELANMQTTVQRASADALLALPPEMRAKLGEPPNRPER